MRLPLPIILLFCVSHLVAQQETIISGKLLGFDKKPMALAHAHILKLPDLKPIAQVQAKQDGSFEIRTKETGQLVVEFTGVNHRALDVPLIIEMPTSFAVTVTLSTYTYLPEFKDVTVLSDVTDFAFEKAQPMRKQRDGTYTLELSSSKRTVAYQLFGVEGTSRAINGTMSDSFEFDDAGDYRSIVNTTMGKARIVFDPRKLVRSAEPYSVVFQNAQHPVAKVALIQLEMLKRAEAAGSLNEQASLRGLREMWRARQDQIAGQLRTETSPLVRQALYMSYLDASARLDMKGDPAIGRQALKEIPPDSKLWMMPTLPLMNVAADLSGDPDLHETYLGRFLQKNPNETMKSNFLLNLLTNAKMQGNEKSLKFYYDIALKYMGDTPFGSVVRTRFKPTVSIAIGKPAPAFVVKSIDDANIVYSNSTFKGKVVLLDFWATWCGPCVAEMENLHTAYEKFKAKSFEILSLSLDRKPDDVKKFRRERWKMPWLHAFVTDDRELTSAFEVVAIPRPILLDGTGKIVALDPDLRGEQLAKTLEKYVK